MSPALEQQQPTLATGAKISKIIDEIVDEIVNDDDDDTQPATTGQPTVDQVEQSEEQRTEEPPPTEEMPSTEVESFDIVTEENYASMLGAKVSVKWNGNDQYKGVIDDIRAESPGADGYKVHVSYEDGEKQWESVDNGTVKILQRPAVITVLPAMSSSSAENLITPLNFTDHLGSKVKVRWSETDEYEGVIDDLRVSKDCLQVHVTYDDGEKQWEPVDKNGKVTYIIDDIPLLRAGPSTACTNQPRAADHNPAAEIPNRLRTRCDRQPGRYYYRRSCCCRGSSRPGTRNDGRGGHGNCVVHPNNVA